ncbi:hypothetical protein [Embleya sp. AB8]|uniref:hypothetical protein n=1 Tax=Embleya sp. AB8 TaxID=3156304 RepID=UPI003C7549B5
MQHNLSTGGQQNWSMTLPPGSFGTTKAFYHGDGVHELNVCLDNGDSYNCTGWFG